MNIVLSPRQESNLDPELRRLLFYPLNYREYVVRSPEHTATVSQIVASVDKIVYAFFVRHNRTISSVGRATHLHCEGQRFESSIVHKRKSPLGLFLLWTIAPELLQVREDSKPFSHILKDFRILKKGKRVLTQ